MFKRNLKFSELSIECKKALLAYCYMTCETMEEVERFYEGRLFSYEVISVDEAKRRCMEHMEDACDGESFDDYHQGYVGDGSDIPYYGDSIFPVIEGGLGEWLDDGWHRFHSYIKYGVKQIPVLKIQ